MNKKHVINICLAVVGALLLAYFVHNYMNTNNIPQVSSEEEKFENYAEVDGEDDDNNLYRGISYRKFNRKFTLADDIIVKDAKLQDGLLKISLEKIIPEEKKPRLITVK